MPRKARIQAEGLIYHVLARGNNKELIFKETNDYYFFLRKLLERKQKYDFQLFCYALLPNHFHLLIRNSDTTSLSTIMKSQLVSYSQYFNRKYDRVGHVFQDRFKSFVCAKDPYLVSLISYIHQNVKRANLVQEASDYEFSSLRTYLYKKRNPLVDIQFITNFLEETFGRKGTVLIKNLS